MNKIIKIVEFNSVSKNEILLISKNAKSTIKIEDLNSRKIELYKIVEAQLGGINIYYPNLLFKSFDDDTIIDPYQERVMSLSNALKVNNENIEFNKEHDSKINSPVFFFIYNSDNYYHFLYDSLPYLILYFELKKEISDLQLLVNYSNPGRNTFYRFFLEFLDLLEIDTTQLLLANAYTIYKTIYISSSLTHGIDSNIEPRKEVYDFFKNLVLKVKGKFNLETPEKFYISRRTWINKDDTNIGTNYTQRRILINEDQLVESLKQDGIKEVFLENLTTIEKILYFSNAKLIVGAIGGGIANVLFSPANTRVVCIVSPTFFDINERFKHSLTKSNIIYYNDTAHQEKGLLKKYMRVQTKNGLIGEILEINDKTIKIGYLDDSVAGWNNSLPFKNMILNLEEFKILDNGLNSPWELNLSNFLLSLHE
jgi:hypothetical protein